MAAHHAHHFHHPQIVTRGRPHRKIDPRVETIFFVPSESYSFLSSKLVKEVYQAYRKAGSNIVETNTFGANPLKLSSR